MTNSNKLILKNIGIDTYHENIIFMRADCHICNSEGFTALKRVIVTCNGKSIISTLNVVYSELLHHNEAGLSKIAMKRLHVSEGDEISISHLYPIESLRMVRAKIYGEKLNEADYFDIISDIVDGKYSNIELSAFVSSCANDNLTIEEIISLTNAMVKTGQQINWNKKMVLDKHCAGGLPGNRTTPIVVSIIAAAGLIIPKSSSRAITSPAGTADVMAAITNVDLTIEEMKNVVNQENGCFVGGGAMQLSPSDDVLISVEKALDIDSHGQMIASVLSKKAAAGSTHVLIDIPVGKTAKVRSHEQALKMKYYFEAVGEAIGLKVFVFISDGSQPIGRGIGPALEAINVLSVLRNEKDAPQDLKKHSLTLAGELLTIAGKCEIGKGVAMANEILESGKAYEKFVAICKAQGRFEEPVAGKYKFDVTSDKSGTIVKIDNRKIARVAKLAGAPRTKGAGISIKIHLGEKVNAGGILFTIFSESTGELEYAKEYMLNNGVIIEIE